MALILATGPGRVAQHHSCSSCIISEVFCLTTCLGELRNTRIEVTITDENTEAVLVEETTTTFDNGFIGYWLPRNTSGTITITRGDFTGSASFNTGADAVTCIADLRLQSPVLQRL